MLSLVFIFLSSFSFAQHMSPATASYGVDRVFVSKTSAKVLLWGWRQGSEDLDTYYHVFTQDASFALLLDSTHNLIEEDVFRKDTHAPNRFYSFTKLTDGKFFRLISATQLIDFKSIDLTKIELQVKEKTITNAYQIDGESEIFEEVLNEEYKQELEVKLLELMQRLKQKLIAQSPSLKDFKQKLSMIASNAFDYRYYPLAWHGWTHLENHFFEGEFLNLNQLLVGDDWYNESIAHDLTMINIEASNIKNDYWIDFPVYSYINLKSKALEGNNRDHFFISNFSKDLENYIQKEVINLRSYGCANLPVFFKDVTWILKDNTFFKTAPYYQCD